MIPGALILDDLQRHTNVETDRSKAIEDYQNEFRFHFPHEHRPAGRNAKTTPLTPVMATRKCRIHSH